VAASSKTVDYHLRPVYSRLGIHSRDELAERMRQASPAD
jgi:DNA-binding CsgD family transcriptional regulator